jgi:hypothetical protein
MAIATPATTPMVPPQTLPRSVDVPSATAPTPTTTTPNPLVLVLAIIIGIGCTKARNNAPVANEQALPVAPLDSRAQTPHPASQVPPHADVPGAKFCDAGGPQPDGLVYHVCDCGPGAAEGCQPGNDTNSGRSAEDPWQSLEKARIQFAKLQPGDAVTLCRGGAFTVQDKRPKWTNAQCHRDHRCFVQSYAAPWGIAATPAPIVHAAGDGFSLASDGEARHEEGYVFKDIDLRSSSGDGQGFFVYNDIDFVSLCGLSIEGFRIGVHAAGSNPPGPGSDARNSDIVLRGSRIRNNHGQGWMGSCDNCTIDSSLFQNNGFSKAILNHNVYLSAASSGMRVTNNTLLDSTIVDGMCRGVSLVVHGRQDNLEISGNTVREQPGKVTGHCWGISVDTGYGDRPESFQNVRIVSNTIVNVGGAAVGLNACKDCSIENNVVIQEQAMNAYGISVPVRDRGESDASMDRVVVRNNSIFFGPAAWGIAIKLSGEGTGYTSTNNAITYAGSGDFTCFDFGLPASSYAEIDSNLCSCVGSSGCVWEKTHGTLDAWRTASGFDKSSEVADPGFAAPGSPAHDLRPRSGDVRGVDRAKARATLTDRDGKRRDARADIGAYEWGQSQAGAPDD